MSEPETEDEPDVDPLDPFTPDPEEDDGSLPGLDPAITLPPEDRAQGAMVSPIW